MSVQHTHEIEHMEWLLSLWPALAKPSTGVMQAADTVEDKVPEFDVRWAAGLFDGEGCIHLVRQRKKSGKPWTHNLRVCMTQNDLAVLLHFQRGMGVGGRIYAVAHRPGHSRQVYTLNFGAAQSIALLQRMGPYLVRKRTELALARRFWTECAPGACLGPRGLPPEVGALREWLYLEMKRVKRAPEQPIAMSRLDPHEPQVIAALCDPGAGR